MTYTCLRVEEAKGAYDWDIKSLAIVRRIREVCKGRSDARIVDSDDAVNFSEIMQMSDNYMAQWPNI